MFRLLLLLTTSPCILVTLSFASDCKNKPPPPPFTRLLTLHYDGKGADNATRQSLQASYGRCRDIDKNAEKMFNFFESFNIDLTIPRRDALKAHFLADYDLQPWVVKHTAILSSFYEYSEHINAPVYRSSWRLVAKRDYNTTQGLISKGTFLHFGLFRVVLPTGDVCIDYQSASPGVTVNNGFQRFQTFHLDLQSELWGPGLCQGVLHNRPGRKVLHWVLTFPPEGQL